MNQNKTHPILVLKGTIDLVFYNSTAFSAIRLLTNDRKEVVIAGKVFVQHGE